MALDISQFWLSIGIDLGTVNTLVAAPGKGVLFEEPTLVARQKKKPGSAARVLAFGSKAKQMLGKEPQQIEVIAPLVKGVISDFDATVAFLEYLLGLVKQLPSKFPRLVKPRALIAVPSGSSEVERRAVRSAALSAGIGQVVLVEKAMVAALGAGLPVEKPAGILVLDIGGGVTEISVISLGGTVLTRSLPLAGQTMDQGIVDFLRMKHGVLIGLPTAEQVKKKIGTVAVVNSGNRQLIVRGRDLASGLPKSVKISEVEVRESLSGTFQEIISQLVEVLEETPPELTNDILKRGIVLTGACSQLPGLEKLVSESTRMPAWVAGKPETTVVQGCVKVLTNPALFKKIKLADRR
ncbi:MAG: rod shape-determining protein [Patescibacteria group bacterium]